MTKRRRRVLSIVLLGLAAFCSIPAIGLSYWFKPGPVSPIPTSGSPGTASVAPIARIGSTYYASIEKAIDDGVLDLCYSSSFLKEYDGNQANINQDNSGAWVDTSVLAFSYVSTNNSYTPTSSSYTSGLPADAGYYLVKVSASNGYSTARTINTRITPKLLYVKDSCSYEIDYNSSSRTPTSLLSNITGISFTDNPSTQSTYSFNEYAVLGMDNGMYYYPNPAISSSYAGLYNNYVSACNHAGLLTAPQSGVTNVVGSTYAVTVASTNSNYEITHRPILKYKTAKVGSSYYTIEDAISLSGTTTITFAGDASSATSYVATSFCALASENPYSTTLSYTLNKNMVVNFQDGTSETYTGNASAGSGGNVYSALIIPENVTLTVPSGRSLIVNATLGYKQPATSATLERGVILNEGTIDVFGTFKSYGYTKGGGYVIAENSSIIYDVLRTYDWPGGNTANKCNSGNCLPVDAWSLHNISCVCKLSYGSKLYGEYYGYEGSAVASILIISSDSSDNCLFILSDSSSYILKKATNANANPTSTALSDINGSNQLNGVDGTTGGSKIGQKDIIELYGSFTDAAFKLNVKISGVSATIQASTDKGFPVGFCDIYLKHTDESTGANFSSTLHLSHSDFIFLPGTKLVIEEGTTLTTAKKADLVFETWGHSSSAETGGSYASWMNQCKDKVDAKMVLNGAATANGSIAGNVVTEVTGATLTTGASSDFKSMTFYVLNKAIGASGSGNVAYKITDMYSMAYINNTSSVKNFVASSTYISAYDAGSGLYYFSGTAGSVTSLSGTQVAEGITTSPCVTPDTLVTMADGSQKPIKYVTQGEMILVWNHETGQIDVAPVTFNEHDEATMRTVTTLSFSDGTQTEFIYEHGYFDVDLREYVYFTDDNYAEFVGHRFLKVSPAGEQSVVTLTNATQGRRWTECYSLPSYYHLNFFADNFLSMPGGIKGLFNIFELDETFKYDEAKKAADIEKYGLFTREELAALGVDDETYDAYPAAYLKVSIGKGIMTEEDLMYLIERYGKYTQ